jgi:hypothetical protein
MNPSQIRKTSYVEYHGMTFVHPSALPHVVSAHAAGIPWATIFSSAGGLATAGALLISLAVLRQSNRTQRQAQQDRHREHASHISFWLTLLPAVPGAHALKVPGIQVTIHVVNTSELPAMAVVATAGIRSDIWRDAGIADGVKLEERTAEWTAVAIAPGERPEIPLHLEAPISVEKIVTKYGDGALIGELLFTDAAGVDWTRTHDGRLIERRSADWGKNAHMSLGQREEQHRSNPRLPGSRLLHLLDR